MKPFLFFCLALLSVVSLSGFVVKKPAADPSGEKIVRFFFEHGRRLSPSYASADCSTLLTKAMEHFFELSVSDRRQINISFTSDLEKKDFWHYFKHKSKCMIGINYNCQHEEMFSPL